jgi:NAD(P)H dehydrogenase (quinone)
MTKVAIVYHSGYGHTAVLADKIAEGVRDAGQTPVVLKIDNATQDFAPIIEQITAADAVVFGAPTYMGDVSGVFKVFADATAGAFLFSSDAPNVMRVGVGCADELA